MILYYTVSSIFLVGKHPDYIGCIPPDARNTLGIISSFVYQMLSKNKYDVSVK